MINRQTRNRSIVLMTAMTAAFAAVGTRFWYLQVKNAHHYQSLAQANALRKLPIPAPRGNIVTSNGTVVATSKPSWTLYYLANGQNMPSSELALLGQEMGESPSYLKSLIAKQIGQMPAYDPVLITSGLTAAEMTKIEENINKLPNLRIQATAVRYYPYGSLMGNIIGYTQKIDAQQYQQLKNRGFGINSLVGAAGLEEQYNQYLHGHAGGEYAEVNRQGQLVKLLSRSGPTPGDTLHLTINWRLEQTAQNSLAYVMKAMRHSTVSFSHSSGAIQGAVIAMNPNNGDVLAMSSLPSYNPNKLVPTNPKEYSNYWTQLVSSPLVKKLGVSPFVNEAISGYFAPGSVFKPIMAVAALASKVVTPTSEIYDPGYFPKDRAFGNWYAPGFGWLNIEQAIGLSDDVFFYTLGYRMGINTMDQWMRNFLINKPTGIDLPGELTSLIPTPARLTASGQGPWTWGWNLNTVIGQGIGRYTLIALARADSAIANGGTLYQPHLVSSISTPSGKLVKKIPPKVQGKINLPYSVWHTVHKGMELSAQDSNIAKGISGTGYGALAGLPVPVASKTGTAQVISQNKYNAFFLSYGPMPHPKILVLVYIREGNWGADSGFVARAIYDQYFKIADPKAQPLFDQVYGLNWKWPFSYHKPATPKY